jgi:hypothetical protein
MAKFLLVETANERRCVSPCPHHRQFSLEYLLFKFVLLLCHSHTHLSVTLLYQRDRRIAVEFFSGEVNEEEN